MFDQLTAFRAEAGTGGRMAEYRRLIGAGCGGVPSSEVDNIIGMLLEVGQVVPLMPMTLFIPISDA